jgi:general secretion pathway protein G
MKQKSVRRIRRASRGFTLVEILIVVIILGILAAIVIPQFTNASTQARQSNLSTQVQSLEQQIALYQLQHNTAATSPLDLVSGWTQLTEYTDINGGVSAAADSTHIFGPYLNSVPVNPLTDPTNGSVVAADPSSKPGWVYNSTTGKIYATGTVSTNYFNPTDGTDSATAPY